MQRAWSLLERSSLVRICSGFLLALAESAVQRQDTFSSVETLLWLAITVMVPDAVFLLTALTWTVALSPAWRAPWAGEMVSVGGGCACQVKGEAPVFLMVIVAVAP